MNDDELFQGDDYRLPEPSPRALAATEFVELIRANKLDVDDPVRSTDRRHWAVSIRPEGAFALCEVFSDSYLRVTWSFAGGLPASRVFLTPIEACGFVVAAFVNRDMALALSIPTRPVKRKPTAKPEKGFSFDV